MVGLRTIALALLCLYCQYMRVKAGTLFAVPGQNVLFNITIKFAPSDNNFFALEKSPDVRHKLMVFLDRIQPPEIASVYIDRINYTGNINRGEVAFWLNNVSLEDAGEFRIVAVGISKVYGSQILAVAGRPDPPVIVEKTIPETNKDHILECRTKSNSRPDKNGYEMSFVWKRNDTILSNNSVQTVNGKLLIIHRLQREDKFDKYTCMAFDHQNLLSNGSSYHTIDPKFGPLKEPTVYPQNMTYFVEEGFEMNSIACVADCHPECICTWDKGEGKGALLSLGVIDEHKRGIYRCTALNPITNISSTTSIEVILTSRSNCSCLLGTCKEDICLSSTIIPRLASEKVSDRKTEEKKEFPVVIVSVVGGAAFACINLALLVIYCKYYRIRLLKSSTTESIPQDSNVIFSPREGQESEEILGEDDTYSTIDDVFSAESVPPAEMTFKSESIRKKRSSVRYTRQPSVSSRRTSSTVDSGIEEEVEVL